MFTVASNKIKDFYSRKKVNARKELTFSSTEDEVKLSCFENLPSKLIEQIEDNKD
jgi:hypothetical protein